MLGILTWILIGLAAGAAIYEVTVTVINKRTTLEALRKVKENNALANAIKGMVKSKDTGHITLDMLDKYGKKLAEVKISGNQVSSDITPNMIFDNI